ncbi:MAG: DUF4453 domain-containing protein [Pseudomonadota bacterium]
MIFRTSFAALMLVFSVVPAHADDVCNDLWFTRNLIMDRAGYCFGSILGQSVYDNADCTGKSVSLSADAQAQVSQIRDLEQSIQCRVDTGQPVIDLEDLDMRRRLIDLPVRDEYESGCIGWLEDPLPLRGGHSAAATVVGEVRRGDSVTFSHATVGAWNYVIVSDREWRYRSAGWTDHAFPITACEQFAG